MTVGSVLGMVAPTVGVFLIEGGGAMWLGTAGAASMVVSVLLLQTGLAKAIAPRTAIEPRPERKLK